MKAAFPAAAIALTLGASACAAPHIQPPLTPPPDFAGAHVEDRALVMSDGARLPYLRWGPTDRAPWAVIVALQHRDALDEEGFRRALAAAGLELADVRDDALIEAGRTYLIGADLVVDVHFKRQPELTPSRHEDLTPMPVSSPRRAWGWGR